MDRETVKEPFDYDDRPAVVNGAVQIEEHERLMEANRKFIPRFVLSQASSCVSYQPPLLIVNRYDDSTLHEALSGIEADAEVDGCLRVYTALGDPEGIAS
jgi:hypothetical protein